MREEVNIEARAVITMPSSSGWGAERFLDPPLMTTLWQLRQALMEEYGTESPAMMRVIDAVMMSSYNLLRIQAWIGDVARSIEHECFAEEALRIKLKRRYGSQIEGFAVEDHLRRPREQLPPVCERAHRQLLQNLQALQRGRPGASPMVAISQAGHVNVAQQQLNIQRRDGCASPPVDRRCMVDGSRPRPPMTCWQSCRGYRSPVTTIDMVWPLVPSLL